jgi:hypothetical protein
VCHSHDRDGVARAVDWTGEQREGLLWRGNSNSTGLAFDGACNRLGRGGGYYDCFIEKAMAKAKGLGRSPPLLVALAYSVQLRDSVPMDARDMPVDVLVTADGIVRRQAHAVS